MRADLSLACATCSAAPPCSSALVAMSPCRRELEGASLIARRLVCLRLQLLEIRLRVGYPLLRDGRVDAREELALLDVVVEVDEQRGDLS